MRSFGFAPFYPTICFAATANEHSDSYHKQQAKRGLEKEKRQKKRFVQSSLGRAEATWGKGTAGHKMKAGRKWEVQPQEVQMKKASSRSFCNAGISRMETAKGSLETEQPLHFDCFATKGHQGSELQ
ncbi:hypothetical protein P7K49_005079, partial [Saguinus oedipus]